MAEPASTSRPCPVCGQRVRAVGPLVTAMDAADGWYRVHVRTHSPLARVLAALRPDRKALTRG